MKRFLIILVSLPILSGCTDSQKENTDYPIQPVSFNEVSIQDQFWLPRINTNREVTIPYDFRKCEETHRINNFAIAGGLKEGSFKGIRYNDSDVFKVMEAAAYSLSTYPDEELESYMDSLIMLVAAAQEDDGYLYTARTIDPDTAISNAGSTRWSLLKQSHELYNIGHMYEAAEAYYQATGKRNFLDVALKSADLVCATFGPEDGKLHDVPGHQEIEIGLVKLYRVSGDEKYLNMAKYFLDQRGDTIYRELYTYNFGENKSVYTQDHLPVTQQDEALGHAVRAAYMYSAMADIAALQNNHEYLEAIHRLWENVAHKKLYITGGIGSQHSGEAFGENYHLPNLSAYNETCAAIANMLWNQRMFLLTGESKYIDVLERVLYNGFLSGVSIHGDKFFYPNPLESDGSHERSPWFNCSCCPTNVARFMPSIPGYIYSKKDDRIYVNLFIGSEAQISLDKGEVKISQTTAYPWEGEVTVKAEPNFDGPFELAIRIPLWLSDRPLPGDLYHFADDLSDRFTLFVNGKAVDFMTMNGYAIINRTWKSDDMLKLSFPIRTRAVRANEQVKEDLGRQAYTRGPIVYCAEGVDNEGKVRNMMVKEGTAFQVRHEADLVNGINTLTGNAFEVSLDGSGKLKTSSKEITMIPYYAWAHRGNGEMMVWFPYGEEYANPSPPPSIASKSMVSASHVHDQILALNDQVNPANSNDHEIPRFTFWNHKGSREWVQYDFGEEESIAYIHVYWFDDGPRGGCRLPESWKALYLHDGEWIEVKKHGAYPIKKDVLNTIEISPVRTTALRLEIQLQQDYSGGILEWKVE